MLHHLLPLLPFVQAGSVLGPQHNLLGWHQVPISYLRRTGLWENPGLTLSNGKSITVIIYVRPLLGGDVSAGTELTVSQH